MAAQIFLRINPRNPRTKILWRNIVSAAFLATPLLVIAVDTNILKSQNPWTMTLGTLYLLCALVKPLRQMVLSEVAVVLFYPAPSTALLATACLLLRLWKETRLLRGPNERSRTAVLTDLGFRLKHTVPLRPIPLLVAAATAWFSYFTERLWSVDSLAWIPVLIFAISIVSVLTSRPDFEEKSAP
jgi:hypothetical protein